MKNLKIKFQKNIKRKLIIFLIISFLSPSKILVFQEINLSKKFISLEQIDNKIFTSQSNLWEMPEVIIDKYEGNIYICDSLCDNISNIFIAWEEYDWDEGYSELFIQKLKASTGKVEWEENGIYICNSSTVHFDRENFGMISDGLEGVIITWCDRKDTNYQIYAQKLNSSGNIQWNPGGLLICNTTGNQFYPKIINDGLSSVIITWVDGRNYSQTGYDIYAQKLNISNGMLEWNENGSLICSNQGSQSQPQMASNNNGETFIIWKDTSSEDPSIYTQKINSSGEIQWNIEGVKVCDYNDNIGISPGPFAEIIADKNGNILISWCDYISQYKSNLFIQKINCSGELEWGESGVNFCNTGYCLYEPHMISDGFGGTIIYWKDIRNGYYFDIYVQKINSNGEVQWTPNGNFISSPLYHQDFHEIDGPDTINRVYDIGMVSDGTNGAIITWLEWNGNTGKIFTQRVDSDGDTLWKFSGHPVCSYRWMARMDVVSDGAGGAVVIWVDARDGSSNSICASLIPHKGLPEDIDTNIVFIFIITLIIVISIAAVVIIFVRRKARNH